MKHPIQNVKAVNQPTTQQAGPGVELYRLNAQTMALLRKKLPKAGIPNNDLHAGFLLGVQHVLDVLQDGFTV